MGEVLGMTRTEKRESTRRFADSTVQMDASRFAEITAIIKKKIARSRKRDCDRAGPREGFNVDINRGSL